MCLFQNEYDTDTSMPVYICFYRWKSVERTLRLGINTWFDLGDTPIFNSQALGQAAFCCTAVFLKVNSLVSFNTFNIRLLDRGRYSQRSPGVASGRQTQVDIDGHYCVKAQVLQGLFFFICIGARCKLLTFFSIQDTSPISYKIEGSELELIP